MESKRCLYKTNTNKIKKTSMRYFYRAFAVAPKPPMTFSLPFSLSTSSTMSSLPTSAVAAAYHSTHNDMNGRLTQRLIEIIRPMHEPTTWPPTRRCDNRDEARKVLGQYMDKVNRMKDDKDDIKANRIRVPIAANFGTSGSGKTTQLFLLMDEFEKLTKGQGKCLYFTVNGSYSDLQGFDEACPTGLRVAHRLLHALVREDVNPRGFIRKVRKELGLQDCDHVLGEPGVILPVIRGVQEMSDDAPLLLAADELRKFGEEPPFGKHSEKAVEALKYLATLSTASLVDFNNTAPTYVCAATYGAYDTYKGLTEGSDRPVYYLPLPPLRLDKWERDLLSTALGKDDSEKAAGRTALWMAQRNARELCWTLTNLTYHEQKYASNTWLEVCKKSFEAARKVGRVGGFITTCMESDMKPEELLQNLFWPIPYDLNTTSFDRKAKLALLGEAAGICTILRQDSVDRVYMHPATAQQLCGELLDQRYSESPFVRLVQQLCKALCALAAQPPEDDSRKLYEKVMLLALACRVATSSEPFVPLRELVGKNSCSTFFDTLVDCRATPEPKFKEERFAFPCATFLELVNGKHECVHVDCSKMPPLADAPWFSNSSNVHNVVIDGLLVLKTADGKRGVALGLQNKEVARPDADALKTFRDERLTHLEWRGKPKNRIKKFLSHHTFVHVLVTPNEPTEGLTLEDFKVEQKGAVKTRTCYEALITHNDIRRWSPMVAYSGCDAR
eukprot:PhM_4_TR13349/c0_g2_i1/m.69220